MAGDALLKDLNGYFPTVLYQMVDDPSTNSIISWSESGKSFIVWNEAEFCKDVLPRFLSMKTLTRFTIRLSNYGFTKVESSGLWEYANDGFVRGRPDLTSPKYIVLKRSPELQTIMDSLKEWYLANVMNQVDQS